MSSSAAHACAVSHYWLQSDLLECFDIDFISAGDHVPAAFDAHDAADLETLRSQLARALM
jgi:hypothetical protein